jgi:hypothetical protein
MNKEEYRSGLLRLLEAAPTPERKDAVLTKLEAEIGGEEQPEEKEKLLDLTLRVQEAYAVKRWQEWDIKNRLLSDEQAVALVTEYARKKGLDYYSAYRDLLSPAPTEPRLPGYTNTVRPEEDA